MRDAASALDRAIGLTAKLIEITSDSKSFELKQTVAELSLELTIARAWVADLASEVVKLKKELRR